MKIVLSALALACGMAFGGLQCRLLVLALNAGKPRPMLLALKAALWLAALVPLALHRPLLALLFALSASVAMIAYGGRRARAAREEDSASGTEG